MIQKRVLSSIDILILHVDHTTKLHFAKVQLIIGNDPAKRKRGFTLVELIVVVIIATVVAALAVPQVIGSISSARLRDSAQALLAAANRARDFAATRRRICRLVIDLDKQSYYLQYQSEPQRSPHKYVAMRGGAIKLTTLGKGVKFVEVQVDPSADDDGGESNEQRRVIAFSPNGSADAAIILFGDDKRTYSLLIDPSSGRVKLVTSRVEQLPIYREDLDA